MDLKLFAQCVLLPAAICGVILSAACLHMGRRKPLLRPESGSALGYGLAITISGGLLVGWPPLPPRESWQWLLYLSLLAAIPGVATHFSRRLGVGSALAVAGLAAWLVVPASQDRFWLWVLVIGATMVTLSLSLDQLARRWAGATFAMTLLLTFVAVSALLVQSGNAKLAMLALTIAGCSASAMVIRVCRCEVGLAGGAVFEVAVLLPALMWNGYFYDQSDLAKSCFLLITFAPLGGWLGLMIGGPKSSHWRVNLVGFVGVLVPVLIAGLLAWDAS